MIVDISMPCDNWEDLPDLRSILIKAACEAAKAGGVSSPENTEISIVLASDDFIRDLNRRYRNKDRPTNVLSFPAGDHEPEDEAPKLLGDIILAFETIRSEAVKQNKPIVNHVSHLTVHGVLHLLGHGHENRSDAETMESLEVDILNGLGVPNPYETSLERS